MANIKDLKKKIKSTKQTLKITKAMKLVSGAKLAKAQECVLNTRPYYESLLEVSNGISRSIEGKLVHPLLNHSEENARESGRESRRKIAVVIISSNKGLCGNYNSLLARTVREKLLEWDRSLVEIHCIGKKVRDLLKKEFSQQVSYTFKKSEPTFDELEGLFSDISSKFIRGEFSEVYVAFNKFNNALSFTPVVKKMLPLDLRDKGAQSDTSKNSFGYLMDEDPASVLSKIIPEICVAELFLSTLEATASEHGARMGAMENASKNCKEIIRHLTLKMNKMRQAAITTELIEVISGAEALNG